MSFGKHINFGRIIQGLATTTLVCLISSHPTLAGIINPGQKVEERWKDKNAYRPNPILFLHGFGRGEPQVWRDDRRGKVNVTEKLNEYFKNYFAQGPTLLNSIKPEQSTVRSYLELISFIDFSQPVRSQLIDRNSSVDTYQAADYYVTTRERTLGAAGWADKLNEAIQKLRTTYVDRYGKPLKVTLVCHSMGGLAAREFLTNPKYSRALEMVDPEFNKQVQHPEELTASAV